MRSPSVVEPLHPVRQLIRAFGLLERVMKPYFARFGISGSQWGVLRNLHRAEESGLSGLRQSELSDRLLIRPASVTGLIDRLERAGFVARFGSSADLRVSLVRLTDLGRQIVEKIMNVHPEQLERLLAGLNGSERKDLTRLLARWSDHLENGLQDETLEAAAVG